MFALTKAQVLLALALSLHSVAAFEPTFSTPRQCEPLSISWSSMDLPTSIALTEITMTLIPLDGNPAHFPPEPYTLAVPCDGAAASAGTVSIPSLPFPAGTDFFAQAYIPGMSGPTKRTVSSVMKVGHSANSNCLPAHPDLDKRKVKQFGKRQISVIGANTQASADLTAAPAATPSTNAPINVIGVGQVPANGSSNPVAASPSASASASGAVPPIGVIGTQVISATPLAGTDAPVNAVPPPSASSSGPAPPVVVVGTSFVDATPAAGSGSVSSVAPTATDNASFVPNFTTQQATQQDATTSCTSTWSTETAQAEATSTDCTTTWATATAQAESTTDCTTTWSTEAAQATEAQASPYDSSYNNSYESSADSQDAETTSCTDEVSATEGSDSSNQSLETSIPSPTQGYNGESNASSYGNFDDMVNAANNMFHAWNPYKPAYTPST